MSKAGGVGRPCCPGGCLCAACALLWSRSEGPGGIGVSKLILGTGREDSDCEESAHRDETSRNSLEGAGGAERERQVSLCFLFDGQC